MVDLVCLRSFVHVYESGTVAAAAAGLGYTPPAVSQHIARLERDLDVALFDRVAGRLRPTDRGVRLREIAAEMLDLDERCRHLAPPGDRSIPVTVVGCASALTDLVVPRLARLPYALMVRGLDDDQALRELRLGTADVAVIQRYGDDDPEPNRRLAYTDLVTEPLRLVLPPGHPPSTGLGDLRNPRWLLNGSETACTRSVLRLLAAAGVEPVVVGDVDDNHALLRLVVAGLGACIVPESVLGAAAQLDLVVATRPLDMRRTIVAVTRRSAAPLHADLIGALAPVADRPVRSRRSAAP